MRKFVDCILPNKETLEAVHCIVQQKGRRKELYSTAFHKVLNITVGQGNGKTVTESRK